MQGIVNLLTFAQSISSMYRYIILQKNTCVRYIKFHNGQGHIYFLLLYPRACKMIQFLPCDWLLSCYIYIYIMCSRPYLFNRFPSYKRSPLNVVVAVVFLIKRPHNESNIHDIDIARKMHYFEHYDYQSPY